MLLNRIDFSKATLKQLVVIRCFDETASLADKADAETELIRRQWKQRRGKPDKHPRSKR